MKNSTRQKLIFIYLLVATAHCKAADPNASWQQADPLNLNNNNQINMIPASLECYFNNNQIKEHNQIKRHNALLDVIKQWLDDPDFDWRDSKEKA